MKKVLSVFLSLLMLLSIAAGLDFSAYAGENIDRGNIALDEETWVYIENGGDSHSFYFTPQTAGYYTLSSYNDEEYYDNYVTLYQYYDDGYSTGWSEVTYNDDGGMNNYFSLSFYLEAGKDYRYDVRMLDGSITGGFNILLSYFDTSEIESISAVSSVTEIIENTHGWYNSDGMGGEFYCYNLDDVLNNCMITIHYNDQSETEMRYSDVIGISCDYNQYENHWTAGNTYDVVITLCDVFETTIQVSIVENPVKEIEFVWANGVPELVQGLNSSQWSHSDGDNPPEYYEGYSWSNAVREDGNQLIVTDKNDNKTTYTFDGDFTDGNGNYIYDEDLDFVDDQYINHWYPGNEYTGTITYMGVSTTCTVKIVENPVESFSFFFSDYPDGITLIEGVSSGYWREDYDEESGIEYKEYYYNLRASLRSEGNQITVNYTDKTSDVFTFYWDKYDESGFYNEDGVMLDDESLDYWTNQPGWSVGGNNYISIEYFGRDFCYPINVIENPVESISYEPATPYTLIEEARGNYELDEDGEFYFNYYYNTSREGDKLTVNYTDKTSVEYTYTGFETVDEDDDEYTYYRYKWVDSQGNSLPEYGGVYAGADIESTQDENHWSVGSDNYLIASYCGVSTQVPVTITESPVESISLELAEPIVLFEKYDHHGYYLTNQKTGERWFYYNAYSINYSDGVGNVLTVKYKDNRTVTYTYDGTYFVDENGHLPEFNLNARVNQANEPWTVGDNYYDMCYAGAAAPVKVTITQSPVKSIVFTPVSEIKLIEGEDGWSSWDDDADEGYFEYRYSYRIGDKFTVNYKNGTSKTYTYGRKEKKGITYSDFYDEDGNRLYYWKDISSDQSYSNQWQAGESHSLTLKYIDVTTEIPVKIIENPVKSISYNPNHNLVFYGNNYSDWHPIGYVFANGDKITVNYKNNTSEVLTYNSDIDEFVDENGIEITHWVDYDFDMSDGQVVIEYLDATCTVPVTVADSNQIAGISYTPAADVVVDPDSYIDYYFNDNGEKIIIYKTDLPANGDVFTLTMKDDSQVVYTFVNGAFFDENGNMFFNRVYNYAYIEGMGGGGSEFDEDNYSESLVIQTRNAQYKEQWKPGNTYQVPVSFCGYETSIDVTVAQSHNHNAGTPAKENYIAPTVSAPGSYDMVTRCTVCGKVMASQHFTIDKLPTGWIYDNGKWTYYSNDGSIATGWQYIGNVWYYFNSDGIMQTGWQYVGNVWYYFNSSGAMQTGWQKISNKWYYFSSSGAMATGWVKSGSKWYYMNSSGAMQTGWIKDGGTWYYLEGSGAMHTGWLLLSGKWYYLDGSGAMLANTSKKISGKTYKFNSNGVCTNP